MQVTSDAGGGFRIAAQGANRRLQFSRSSRAIGSTLNEQRLELWVLDVFSAGLEAFLAIFAGLDQVVQDGD
ncbi:hypothetical protein D3C84_1307850 [compost metagenome]